MKLKFNSSGAYENTYTCNEGASGSIDVGPSGKRYMTTRSGSTSKIYIYNP